MLDKKIALGVLISLLIIGLSQSSAQVLPRQIMPNRMELESSVPSPSQFLGYGLGEWHWSHDHLYRYCQALAESSPLIELRIIGYSHEQRPLINLIISSKSNLSRLEELRKEHLNFESDKIVIYQGYSIHGDEASGSHAAMLYAYYLAASRDKSVKEQLENTIVIIDPCMNPDGMQKFSTWVNSHKSFYPVSNMSSREHVQSWPTARTNHYWFDLNRDWISAVHPETQARLRAYYHWRPHILTDHHEMGSDRGFFFQPGIASRTNPMTPEENQILTERLSAYQAKAFDEKNRSYYSKESFDDYFYGKGSTYPDISGGIGILFEQSSARGHLRKRDKEDLSFAEAIENHFIASKATLKGANELREDILSYKKDFFKESREEYKKEKHAAFVFTTKNRGLMREAVDLLRRHDIDIFMLKDKMKVGDIIFEAYQSWVIPFEQQSYRLIKAIFKEHRSFNDSVFYDVSTWPLHLAYNLKLACIKKSKYSDQLLYKPTIQTDDYSYGGRMDRENTVAYALRWNSSAANKVLFYLLGKGVKCRLLNERSSYQTINDVQEFDPGTIIISVADQELSLEELDIWITAALAAADGNMESISSNLAIKGSDIGAPSLKEIKEKRIGILCGWGINTYRAGEYWHLFDKRLGTTPLLLEWTRLSPGVLQEIDVLLMPDGSYQDILILKQASIVHWLQKGGTLIAQGQAFSSLAKAGLVPVKFNSFEKPDSAETAELSYEEHSKYWSSKRIGGAVFRAEADAKHPLMFGIETESLPLFKRGNLVIASGVKESAAPLRYSSDPLICGYAPEEGTRAIASSPALIVAKHGNGKIIGFVDAMSFRSYWRGTEKLLVNAVLFSDLIDGRSTLSKEK